MSRNDEGRGRSIDVAEWPWGSPGEEGLGKASCCHVCLRVWPVGKDMARGWGEPWDSWVHLRVSRASCRGGGGQAEAPWSLPARGCTSVTVLCSLG